MRRAVSIVMLCIFLIPIGWRIGVYISFEINQEYIAAELCENKDKPEMHCDGNCYLAKQIQLTDNQEQDEEAPLEVQRVPSTLLFCEDIDISPLTFSLFPEEQIKHHYKPQFNSSVSHLNAVYHPPEFSTVFQS
jgi:hypothetical protein